MMAIVLCTVAASRFDAMPPCTYGAVHAGSLRAGSSSSFPFRLSDIFRSGVFAIPAVESLSRVGTFFRRRLRRALRKRWCAGIEASLRANPG